MKKEIPLCNITQVVPEKSSQKENFPFTIHFSTSEGDSKNMRYDATSEVNNIGSLGTSVMNSQYSNIIISLAVGSSYCSLK